MGVGSAGSGARPRIRIALAAALLIAGCAPAAERVEPPQPPSPTAPADTPPEAPTPEPTDRESEMGIEPGLEGLAAAAVDDLAARTGADPDDIEVLTAKTVVWPDASLGCPHPDMRYTQVPVDGALFELRLGERTYRYHAGGREAEPFLCEQPARTPPPATLDPTLDPGTDV